MNKWQNVGIDLFHSMGFSHEGVFEMKLEHSSSIPGSSHHRFKAKISNQSSKPMEFTITSIQGNEELVLAAAKTCQPNKKIALDVSCPGRRCTLKYRYKQ